MRRIVILAVFAALFGSLPVWGQSCYWVAFTDKNNSSYSLSNPEEFLSERAVRRRENQNIAIDSLDLPVNPEYISRVLQRGATLLHSSKWLNGITVKTTNDNFVDNTLLLPFVKEVQLTKRPTGTKSAVNKFTEPEAPYQNLEIDTTLYGNSVYQVAQLNGQFLHNQNFRGQGKHIAVLDAGFYRTDQYPAFDSLWAGGQILGTKNFVDQEEGIFEGHYHGMSVLSVMGGNVPGHLIGTAPKASYWIIRTEDVYSEFLVEEDNWVVGAEFADSVGVDIINSSLGYCTFDDPGMDHTHSDMDGHTTRISKGANIAASRGMLVFASAGNEGRQNNLWKYIITPSDGDSVLAIGAANKDGVPAPFTSPGPASDGDVKPNVSAVGWNTIIQRSNGKIGTGNGTSYSSPVVAGAAACLWQANPHASAAEVKRALEQSAHLYVNPDSLLGYGIPDLKLADKILKTSILKQWADDATWLVYPNPASNYIVLQKNGNATLGKVQLAFYTLDGKLVRKEEKPDAVKIIIQNLQALPQGLLLLQIISDDVTESVKIRKSP
ncbi:S8 family serine peptidase [Mariniphaga sediminis]|uniref:S8 family serine peptidase n=1 Tax=Mariniphaga sediminis TaxID=1628158 RepID=UPI003569BC45